MLVEAPLFRSSSPTSAAGGPCFLAWTPVRTELRDAAPATVRKVATHYSRTSASGALSPSLSFRFMLLRCAGCAVFVRLRTSSDFFPSRPPCRSSRASAGARRQRARACTLAVGETGRTSGASPPIRMWRQWPVSSGGYRRPRQAGPTVEMKSSTSDAATSRSSEKCAQTGSMRHS